MAPRVVPHLGTRPTERGLTVDERSVVYGEERGQDHPHACMDGKIYLSYTVFDEEIGDEVEKVEVIPCRRCAEASLEVWRGGVHYTTYYVAELEEKEGERLS